MVLDVVGYSVPMLLCTEMYCVTSSGVIFFLGVPLPSLVPAP